MKKKWILIGAIVATLAVTGSVFAYTYTTASASIGAVGDSDYAVVEPSTPAINFGTNVLGRFRGDIPAGYLFEITPDADYTGDLQVDVYLTNADELTFAYKHLNMKLELWDSTDPDPLNMFESATGHTFQLITLDNGRATFDLDQSAGTAPFKVRLAGGSFATHGMNPLDWTAGSEVSPLLYCEVTQR